MVEPFLAGDSLLLILAALAGVGCGFINAAASCGSAVLLPVLLMLGLDPIAANATSRVPVLVGAISATGTFHRGGHVPWPLVWRLSLPLLLGTGAGTLLAEVLPSRDLGLLITTAVLLAFILLTSKLKRRLHAEQAEPPAPDAVPRPRPWHLLLFFGIGLWIGCVVVEGATYMLLALMLAAGLTLPQGNAAKNAMLVPITLLSLLVFAVEGSVQWEVGAVMALGSIAGGFLGARVALLPRGRIWVYRLLLLIVLLELVHLTLHYVFHTA